MIKRLVGWLVLLPLSLVLILFALANRQWIEVRFDPFMPETPLIPSLHTPQFALVYAALIIGVLLGGTATWFSQGHNRQEKRHLKRETNRLQNELAALRRDKNAAQHPKGTAPTDDLLELE